MNLESSESEDGFSDIDSEMQEKLNWNGRGRSKSPDGDVLTDFDALYQKALEEKKKEEANSKKVKNFSRSLLQKKSSTENAQISPKKTL
jgi:hypothetical protein